MFSDNLVQLRKLNDMTQEELAEAVGVTRQAIAKWEAGDSVPDLERCKAIADAFGVSLDDLANYDTDDNMGMGVAPKGKHIFGLVTVGEKGQIVIPAKARKLFKIESGDHLIVLGDEGQGLAIIKAKDFLKMADAVKKMK
ncbi:MAG: helix-turn-helix domain-containing protein [Eubacterium sp.]|nr:helix-turn-helix domain-containing protein [Eubacterium sp.]